MADYFLLDVLNFRQPVLQFPQFKCCCEAEERIGQRADKKLRAKEENKNSSLGTDSLKVWCVNETVITDFSITSP